LPSDRGRNARSFFGYKDWNRVTVTEVTTMLDTTASTMLVSSGLLNNTLMSAVIMWFLSEK